MTFKSLSIAMLALFIVGCQSGSDNSASTAPTSPTPAATAGATGGAAAATSGAATTGSSADNTAATDSGASANSLVGTWTNDDKDIKNEVSTFKDDGTIEVTGNPEPKATITFDGTYKLDGDKLTLTLTGGKAVADPDADAKTKKDMEDANKNFSDPEAMKKVPPDVNTIAWKGKDSFTATGKDGKVVTFTRKS